MITWEDFKLAVEIEFKRLGVGSEVKLRYIDSGGYMKGEDISVDIEERDATGKPTEVSIWS